MVCAVRSKSVLALLSVTLLFSAGCHSGKKPPKLKDITQIAAGDGHVCALFRHGVLRCWGDNAHGQAGAPIATTAEKSVLQPQEVKLRAPVVTVFAGGTMSCATLQGGGSQCWGQITGGDGKAIPIDVEGTANVIAFSLGRSHGCVLTGDNDTLTTDVSCFGDNSHGQLGTGANVGSAKPVQIAGLHHTVQVAVGAAHSCALTDGSVRCWGDNSKGQLGDGTTTSQKTPTLITGLPRAVGIFAGAYDTCAILTDRSVSCWGDNSKGQLGDGTHDSRSTPRSVSSLISAEKIALGESHSCAIMSDGTVRCWGDNAASELADGTRTERTEPVRVSGQYEVKELVTGLGFSCVRTEEVTRCWGSDATGAIGDWRVSSEPATVPVDVRF